MDKATLDKAQAAYVSALADMQAAQAAKVVADKATKDADKAMRDFVKSLVDGNPKADALRKAQNAAYAAQRDANNGVSLAARLFADRALARDNASK